MTSGATSSERFRRAALLGLALASAPAAVPAQTADPLSTAAERAETFLRRRMAEDQVPGAALVVVDRNAVLLLLPVGSADLQAGRPVTAGTLFQIGSLSKTLTAMAALQLREEGLLALDRPITAYLPWFRVQSSFGPITLHHLLTHTAGLPRDRDDIPSSPYAAAALRERELGFPPGVRFAYSNIGYQLLSLLMEEVEGDDFERLVRRRVLGPAGMYGSAAAITNDLRSRLATGYQYWYDDRPPHPSHPVVPATWAEHRAGDANVASTPADLAALLRLLLARGAGPGGLVVDTASFRLMVESAVPAPELGPAARYGYGIVEDVLDGRPVLWNSGGMQGFRAHLVVSPADGIGAAVVMNGPGNVRRAAEYALRAFGAAQHGRPLPDLPPEVPPALVANAPDYAGVFTDTAGTGLTFDAVGDRVDLVVEEERVPLERLGGDRFLVNHPRFALFPLQFGRDPAGRVVELVHGERWLVHARYRGPRSFDHPARWAAFTGHYRSRNPWFNNFRVILRKGVLLLVAPEGTEEILLPLDRQGLFRVGPDPRSPERLLFDTVISGRALRATLSGVSYYRTPE